MKQGNNNNSCSTCSCDYLQLHLLPAPKSLFSERFNVRVMSIIWFIALVASFSLKYLPISEIKILPMLMSAENGGYPPTQHGDIRSLFWLFSLMALQH